MNMGTSTRAIIDDGFARINELQAMTQEEIEAANRLRKLTKDWCFKSRPPIVDRLPDSAKRFEFTVLQNPKDWSVKP